MQRLALALLTMTASAALLIAAPAPTETTETVKDRTTFLPHNKYNPLPGKTIGVLVSDVVAVMGLEGRSGAADNYGFSAANASYRWVYVPVKERPVITNFTIRAGEKGDQSATYPNLGMANPNTVKQWDINVPYSLVEVEVNGGLGAPPDQGFVATKMKRLDDTKDYPLKVHEVVSDLRKRYAAYTKEHQKEIDDSLAEIQKTALKDKKLTGPRQTKEIFYITWLPESEHLRVCFRTTITDGAFTTIDGPGGPGGIDPDFFPLPPNPGRGLDKGAPQAAVALPPPPPRPIKMTVGTQIGVEFGVAYEVNKSGKVDKVSVLPNQTFSGPLQPSRTNRAPGGRTAQPPPAY
jgi:hypothetical protein